MKNNRQLPIALALLMCSSTLKSEKKPLSNSILRAVAANHTQISDFLINKAGDNQYDKDGALIKAVELENKALVAKLLSVGANPDAALNEEGKSVLMLAASTGNVEIVRLLLDAGADWRAEEETESGSYLTVYNYIYSQEIKALVDANENEQRVFDAHLITAIKNDNATAVTEAIEKSADVNAGNGQNRPLYVAIQGGNPEIVKLLIKNDALTNHPIAQEPSFLQAAVEKLNPALVEILIEGGAHVNALHAGQTALHTAIQKGSQEIVSILVTHEADLNIKDIHGKTAIDYASQELRRAISAISNQKQSEALKAEESRLKTEQRARQKKQSIDEFFEAIRSGDSDAVQKLINAGADVNVAGDVGETPLIVAALAGHAKIAKLLMKNGADAEKRDTFNHAARYYANEEVKQVLNKSKTKKQGKKDEL